ncbi:MAG TPA: hypothetical protein VN281_11355, partial [Verrucomicrobiae bacterium]|nr:hypothetical protein [Verrucomicrobiae bacterium]
EFGNPYAIALDSKGNLYVADSQNHRVQKFLRRQEVADVAPVQNPNPNLNLNLNLNPPSPASGGEKAERLRLGLRLRLSSRSEGGGAL